MQLHIKRPLSVHKVLVPKSYPIELVSHTFHEWSTIYAISSRIFDFFILKKITSFFVKRLHFLHLLLDNFLKNQKFKNISIHLHFNLCVPLGGSHERSQKYLRGQPGVRILCYGPPHIPLRIIHLNVKYAFVIFRMYLLYHEMRNSRQSLRVAAITVFSESLH